jgi:hypothetical protein
MKITYTGDAHRRIIDARDFPNREGDFHYEWTPGSWQDVDEETAKWLLEHQRHEFVQYDDPKGRDHRTQEELYAEAQELDIKGRSTMSKEELRDAVNARRAEVEGDSTSTGETQPVPETPEEEIGIQESREAVIAQSDTPDRTESDTE